MLLKRKHPTRIGGGALTHLSPDSIDRISSFLREGRKESVTISDVMALADLMATSFDTVIKGRDEAAYREFCAIADAITRMRTDIGNLQASELGKHRIPEAGQELDAIVEATENATHTIMEATEGVMAADPNDPERYRETVNNACMTIFEACSFQDITGQRIAKVVETLSMIESRVTHFAEAFGTAEADAPGHLSEKEEQREKRKRELILNGPQNEADAISQDSVDALFS